MQICSNCGTDVTGQKFCSRCGDPVDSYDQPKGASLTCPRCYAQLQAGVAFCSQCGQNVQLPAATPAPPAPVHCPQCGSVNDPSRQSCHTCSGHLPAIKPAYTPTAPLPPAGYNPSPNYSGKLRTQTTDDLDDHYPRHQQVYHQPPQAYSQQQVALVQCPRCQVVSPYGTSNCPRCRHDLRRIAPYYQQGSYPANYGGPGYTQPQQGMNPWVAGGLGAAGGLAGGYIIGEYGDDIADGIGDFFDGDE
jgi:hypothetical protein